MFVIAALSGCAGNDAARPAVARLAMDSGGSHADAAVLRLPPTAPDDELERSPPGRRVKCEWRHLTDGRARVDTELAD